MGEKCPAFASTQSQRMLCTFVPPMGRSISPRDWARLLVAMCPSASALRLYEGISTSALQNSFLQNCLIALKYLTVRYIFISTSYKDLNRLEILLVGTSTLLTIFAPVLPCLEPHSPIYATANSAKISSSRVVGQNCL